MKHRKIQILFGGLLLILACTQCTLNTPEEVLTDFKKFQTESRAVDIDLPEKVDTFFINEVEDSTLLRLIHRFKNNLKDSTKIETLNQYIQLYGYPLWEKSFLTYLYNGFLYAIPVAKDGNKIETIWFFKVTEKKIHSFSTNRKTLNSIDWMYDYFTSVLYYKPGSSITKIKRRPQSRAIQCNEIYTGYIDEYGNEHLEYSYTHCWDDGAGGGFDYVYEDESERDNEKEENIDYEVDTPNDGGSGYSGQHDNNPSISTILNNTNVQAQKTKAVENMKADLEKGRREYGFWIFYNSKDKKIYTGNMKSGPLKTDKTSASIQPGSKAPSDNGNHIPTTSTAIAFFHTHTAMTNLETGQGRKVGISTGDYNYAKSYNVIMIVEDYVGIHNEKLGHNIIMSGHNANDEMKTYIYEP